MDANKTKQLVYKEWDKTILPSLEEYIRIPNQSPAYDPNVLTNGFQDQAVELMVNWCNAQNLKHYRLEVLREPNRTPIILIEIDATHNSCNQSPVLMYGHMDKQPPLKGTWSEGLDPYIPVTKDGKLYGRGGADDGYAVFAAITSIKAIQAQGLNHGKIFVLVEASEESGSTDLTFWIDTITPRLGDIGFVICLDSGCGNYDHFWLTTSLRGLVSVAFKVQLLTEGVHSGLGSGVVADSFRVIRNMLDRVENSNTGEILVRELYTEIPKNRISEAEQAADSLGELVYSEYPFYPGTRPVVEDRVKILLAKTWEPKLSYVGIDGIPDLKGGNVLRAWTTIKLSMRIPPHVDKEQAGLAIVRELTRDPPYGANIEAKVLNSANGWESPRLQPWLEDSCQRASNAFYGTPSRLFGEGGTIPFMNMLGVKFPRAQFVITGVLGPKSNAHGPNEFLHINMGKNITCCCAHVLYDYFHH